MDLEFERGVSGAVGVGSGLENKLACVDVGNGDDLVGSDRLAVQAQRAVGRICRDFDAGEAVAVCIRKAKVGFGNDVGRVFGAGNGFVLAGGGDRVIFAVGRGSHGCCTGCDASHRQQGWSCSRQQCGTSGFNGGARQCRGDNLVGRGLERAADAGGFDGRVALHDATAVLAHQAFVRGSDFGVVVFDDHICLLAVLKGHFQIIAHALELEGLRACELARLRILQLVAGTGLGLDFQGLALVASACVNLLCFRFNALDA